MTTPIKEVMTKLELADEIGTISNIISFLGDAFFAIGTGEAGATKGYLGDNSATGLKKIFSLVEDRLHNISDLVRERE